MLHAFLSLPFTLVSSRPAEFQATADVRPSATSDPLLRIQGTEADADLWNSLPPIYRTETYVMPTAGSEILATVRVNNVPLPEPLIIRRTSGTSRSVAVLGYGLHRWKLMGMGPQGARGQTAVNVLAAFLNNTMSWLSVDADEQRVRIRSTRTLYAAGEPVAFQASVLDETFSPAEEAAVRVELSGPGGKREVLLAALGGGRYASTVGPLPAGDYRYTGKAIQKGRGLGDDAGRFTVGTLGLEESAIMQNADLLRTMATRTGAKYGLVAQAEEVARSAVDDARRKARAITSERDVALWHLPWPLLIAIMAFSLEWFLRKRAGLV